MFITLDVQKTLLCFVDKNVIDSGDRNHHGKKHDAHEEGICKPGEPVLQVVRSYRPENGQPNQRLSHAGQAQTALELGIISSKGFTEVKLFHSCLTFSLISFIRLRSSAFIYTPLPWR